MDEKRRDFFPVTGPALALLRSPKTTATSLMDENSKLKWMKIYSMCVC
jgi:hypothetical protein